MARIMAFDFGQKRTGIAVSDSLRIIANPLDTVDSSSVFDFIKRYISEEEVDQFVVGVPKNLDNTATHGTPLAQGFIQKLKNNFPNIPVAEIDERFTSKIASNAIFMSGAKKKKRQQKGLIDKVSAVIILQSYMEQQSF